MDEVHDRIRQCRDQEEHTEHYPYRHLAPAAPTQTAREFSEPLDRSGPSVSASSETVLATESMS